MKQNKTNLRKRITDSAIRLFARKGFYETTIDDIARSAKIAKGTVYLYFKDKSSLYICIIDEHFTRAISFLEEIKEQKISETEKLKKIGNEWISYMLKFKNFFPIFAIENINLTIKIMKGIKPIVLPRIHKIVQLVAEIIAEGIKKGEFRDVNPQLTALYFLNTIRTTFLAYIFIPDLKNQGKTVTDIFLYGLKKEGR